MGRRGHATAKWETEPRRSNRTRHANTSYQRDLGGSPESLERSGKLGGDMVAIMAAAAEEGDLPKFELSCEAKTKLTEGFTKVCNKA